MLLMIYPLTSKNTIVSSVFIVQMRLTSRKQGKLAVWFTGHPDSSCQLTLIMHVDTEDLKVSSSTKFYASFSPFFSSYNIQ